MANGFYFSHSTEKSADNLVIVKDKSQLLNIDPTKVYHLDGMIDMGTQSITVPEAGISFGALNAARDVGILYSDEPNHSMFVSPDGGYSGNVVVENCTITCSGANSKVFDLNNMGNGHALDITNVNFTSCTSLGKLANYRQLLMSGVGFLFLGDGLELIGSWAGARITSSIAILFPALKTLFKAGSGLIFNGSFLSDINFLSTNASSILTDFAPSNIAPDAGFLLTNVRTTATNPLPNFPSSSIKARIRDCNGIINTYVGGRAEFTTETATTVNATNTPYRLAGTTTYDDLNWFTQTTNNAFVYASSQKVLVRCQAVISLSGIGSDEVKVYFRKKLSGTDTYVDLCQSKSTLNMAGRAENMVVMGFTSLSQGDELSLWAENLTGTRNITVAQGSILEIAER